MLKAVRAVRDECLKQCDGGEITLETITRVFHQLTAIDHIVFVRYDTPDTNPIWGEFSRWSRSPGVYRPAETVVEVRYASHLTIPKMRYVVSKELCHSLDVSEGVCDVSSGAMQNLVDAFSLISAGGMGQVSPPLRSELLAQAGALEILCSFAKRQEIVARSGIPNDAALAAIAQAHNMPVEPLVGAFQPETMQAIEWLLNND